jgi:ABC-type lipoprotein export system ATPase subunit
MSERPWSNGSQWHRWDPHIHAPGTLLEDHFGGDWAAYFDAIESATPEVAALGISDYFTLRAYKNFLATRPDGSCPNVQLVFANIELRLLLQTKDGAGVNLHLLVSPDDPQHVKRMEEELGKLSFSFRKNPYPCTDEGLMRLGRAQPRNDGLPDEAAIKAGANQFKVDLTALYELFAESEWLRDNVIVAVAAGKDGLSGLSKDASFRSQREELGRFAHIVFSALEKDRDYWLGRHPGLAEDNQTPKPCLHGSDAHEIPRVLRPGFDRRTWLRGDPTFETLRQAIAEPARRVFIGESPPLGAQRDEAIASITAEPAKWLKTTDVRFNPGLVAIIGAKGSGKTALADLLALGTGADEDDPGPASFIGKARPLLGSLTAQVTWGDGTTQRGNVDSFAEDPYPRVQYLSQQFVERLSAPLGLTEPLVEEIERVVFGAIPDEDLMETGSFGELRDLVLEGPRSSRDFEQQTIQGLTTTVANEQAIHRALPERKKLLDETHRAREALEKEIAAIPVKAGDETVKAHQAASLAVQNLTDLIAKAERRTLDIKEVGQESARIVSYAESQWRALKARYPGLLVDETWEKLRPAVTGEATSALAVLEEEARNDAKSLRLTGKPSPPDSSVLVETPEGLAALTGAREKLAAELGLDATNAKRRGDLEKRLVGLKAAEVKADEAVKYAEGAEERFKAAGRERLAAYERVFATLSEEQSLLLDLYRPLSDRVRSDPRLAKLSVVVNRVVAVEEWATRGEELFDLRRPPFNGKGSLLREATAMIAGSWATGSPSDVRAAMRTFYEKYVHEALDAMAQGVTRSEVGGWFYSTEHITVRYGIEYEGVEIARLSPGTRGVVLLTLYLALDQWDVRPLLIDQPEENLDPSSVYDDLVPFFREAAERRQIIMVTHNANLVVNTDADQVIVANAVRPNPASLPDVRYEAGGLEDPHIRNAICRLLEGGEQAFRKRGIRYGLP